MQHAGRVVLLAVAAETEMLLVRARHFGAASKFGSGQRLSFETARKAKVLSK